MRVLRTKVNGPDSDGDFTMEVHAELSNPSAIDVRKALFTLIARAKDGTPLAGRELEEDVYVPAGGTERVTLEMGYFRAPAGLSRSTIRADVHATLLARTVTRLGPIPCPQRPDERGVLQGTVTLGEGEGEFACTVACRAPDSDGDVHLQVLSTLVNPGGWSVERAMVKVELLDDQDVSIEANEAEVQLGARRAVVVECGFYVSRPARLQNATLRASLHAFSVVGDGAAAPGADGGQAESATASDDDSSTDPAVLALLELVQEFENLALEHDLYDETDRLDDDAVTLAPQLMYAFQTSDDTPIVLDLGGGWTATLPVDPGGGDALEEFTNDTLRDEHGVDLTHRELIDLVQQHPEPTWADLGVSLPEASMLQVAPDDGQMAGIDESSVTITSPSGREFLLGDSDDGEDVEEGVHISLEWEPRGGSINGRITVDIDRDGEAIKGSYAFDQEIDCCICEDYEVYDPDLSDAISDLTSTLETWIEELRERIGEGLADDEAGEEMEASEA